MKKVLLLSLVLLTSLSIFSQTFNASPSAAITNDGQHCYTINVTGVGTIDGAYGLETICIDITHTWDSDLELFLIAPDGTTVELSTGNGGSGDNYSVTCFDMGAATNITAGTAPFNGSYIPEGDFATINNGQNADGSWQLCVEDVAGGDDGTLNDWSITFGNNPVGPAPPISIVGCSGTFADLGGTGGGASGDYGENESQTWTICPDAAGMSISLDFIMWDVVGQFVGDDELIVYDGDDNTAPVLTIGNELNPLNGIVQATSGNATGCLTFEWTSNADGLTGAGWEADISCVQPCQLVQTSWTGSNPADVGGYIDICQGETVDFSAIGIYENTTYAQSDVTSTFDWDFGDGTTATGQNVSHTFNDGGGYDIDLVITDDNGCLSTNDLGIRVRVSTTPTFTGTAAATDPVCLGDCSNLTGVPNMTPWSTPPGQVLAGTTFLPDGSGVSYSTGLVFDNFAPGATVNSVSDIVDICANIEHSYAGDLNIEIICPDGSSTTLVDYTNGTNLGWDHVGEPIDNTDSDGGSAPEGPGVGYDYCWSPTGLITWNDAGGDPANIYSYTDVNGATYTDINYIPAGTYDAMGNWNDLIGCPLNGQWTIVVTDNLSSDDGYIFEWGISFDPSLYPDGWGFTPTVDTEVWSGTTVTAGNPTTACPPDLGPETYTYTIVDDFGCSYDTSITINAIGLDIDSVSVNPTCNGLCDGSISIFGVTGNVGALSYAWSGGAAAGQTTASVTGLCAGTYEVTVTDGGASCTNVQTFTLVDPPALTMSLSQTPDNCGSGDGTITVDVTNGLAPIDYNWAGQETGSVNNETDPYTITALEAGNYSITATDANAPGCTVTGSIAVATTGAVTAGFTSSGNQCLEGNSFDFTNTGTVGGTITYDVTSPGGTTTTLGGPDVTGFVADEVGVWSVTQTITNGSCTDSFTLTFTIYDEPQLSLLPTDVTCNQLNTGAGTSDGTITASVTNSNGGEIYTIITGSGSFTSNQATGLTADTYDVVIVDNQGCNDTASVTINEPPQIALTLTSTSNPCNGDCIGTASVALVSGGVGPFTYLWSTTETTQNIANLCQGTYQVTVYDSNSPANGCYEIGSQTISEPPAETYTNSSTDASCGLATGSATINVTTAIPSATYEYTWYDNIALTGAALASTPASASTTNTLSNVAAGTYYVEVINANGCTDVIAVTVIDNGSPTLNVTSSTDILCNGGNNGQITVDISGTLNPNYTYEWEFNSTPLTTVGPTTSVTDQQTNLVAGTYDITVTDVLGCQSSVNLVLTEPSAMNGSITVVDANCSTPGSLTVNTTGGTTSTPGIYSYQWDNDGTADPATDPQMISVGTGVYNVTVYDDNNCELILNATVNDIGGIDADTTINSHVLCNGSNEGSITANPIGGVALYSYSWTPAGYIGSSSATYSGLPAGAYTCIVTDANGCSAVTSAVIIEPSKVVANIFDSTMVSCFGGSDGTITAEGLGGTPPYTFQWDATTGNQTTAQATGLSAGCYTVTVSDNNLCPDDTTICIHEPTQIVLSVDEYDAHCDQNDGSATVNITGGTPPYPTINWSSGVATAQPDSITGLGFGSYSVTVFDNNGCSESIVFNIDSMARGVMTVSAYDSVSCFGGSDGMVQVSVGGGGGSNTFVWSPSGFTDNGTIYSDLVPGTYSVTATDIWGCELYASQPIAEPTQLQLSITTLNDRCAGACEGEADADVTGGTLPYYYQWNNNTFSTDTAVNGLCEGWYTLTATDDNGCVVIDSVEITEPEAITLTATIDSSSCNQADGGITTYPSGGTGPYTFEWTPDTTNNTLDSLLAISQGNYCVTVTDSKLCTFDTCFIVVDQNSPIVQIDSIVSPLCNGDNSGEAYASFTGGIGPYTWTWSSDSLDLSGISSNVATNLDGGNVWVTVTDNNGCKSTDAAFLVENPILTVSVVTQDVLCFGDSTGSATALALGGTGLGTYTYSWTGIYNGLTPNDSLDSSLPSGVYNLLVTDSNGCTNTINNITIYEPTQLGFTSSFTGVNCNGESDGTATIYPTGGEGTYTYLWPDFQTDSIAFGLSANTYEPTITDGYGCELVATVTVTEPAPFVLDSIVYNHISCYGAGDASITTYVSGGVLNYDYLYTDPSSGTYTTQTISSLGIAGTYIIHVEDGNGCTIDTSHIVNQPPALTQSYTKNDESCYGYCDGEINVALGGGTGDLIISWNDIGVDSIYRDDLCPGTYEYTVTDENSCTITNSIEIVGNPELSLNLQSSQNATCGQCDGAATVQVIGGIPAYTFGWFGGNFSICGTTPYPNGQNTITQNQLPQGIHSVWVEDGNACRDTLDIDISNLTGPAIDTVVTNDVLCHGDDSGNAQVTVSGGNGVLTYTWTDQSGSGSILAPNTTIQSNLYAGTYFFAVEDENGCVDNEVIQIDQNEQILVNVINVVDATCDGYSDGSATMQGFGGTGAGTYSYLWSTIPSQSLVTATGLQAGGYLASITDANGCSATETFIISDPNPITLSTIDVQETSCAYPQLCDGSVSVYPVGGNSNIYNYNWFGYGQNENTTGGLCAGTYQLQVTDVEGCFGDFSFDITEPDTIQVTLGQDPIACNDPNGMVWIQSITGGTGSPYYNTQVTHMDPAYPLGGSNGWTCTWGVNATQAAYVDGVYNQYYEVQVFDPNNLQCSVVQGIAVGEVPEPYLFSQQVSQTSCNGVDDGEVLIQVKEGTMDFTYSWSYGANIPFASGSDSVRITNIPAGTYSVIVTDDNGCEVLTSFTVVEPNPISVYTSMVPDEVLCISQTAVVYANGSGGTPPYKYNWLGNTDSWTSQSSLLASPLQDTIVYIDIKDANECSASSQKVIIMNDSLSVEAIADGEICEGESFNLDIISQNGGNGNYNYFWSNGSDEETLVVTPTSDQVYVVTLTDNCGTPRVIDSVEVRVYPNPYVQTISRKDSCEPLGMVFIPYPEDNDINYHWNFGDPGSTHNESNDMYASHLFVNSGSYDITLSLSSSVGCTYDTTFAEWITVYPLPEADFGMDINPASLFNNTVTFTDLTLSEDAIDNIQWDFGNGDKANFLYLGSIVKTAYDEPRIPGYDVTLFAETRHGCKDTATHILRVNDDYTLYVPNAFTPGLDGRNDYFYPIGHGVDKILEYQLIIYDRWGQEIYNSTVVPYGTDKRTEDFDPTLQDENLRGWNGRYQNTGEFVQNGVYSWYVKLHDVNKVAHERTGKVTVIR